MLYVDESGEGTIQSIIPDELEIAPNASKEWAELLLKNWNRAVQLWDESYQLRDQQEYAMICCTWIVPNGMVEPHCVAEGK